MKPLVKKLNKLIEEYGSKRQIPIITDFDKEEKSYSHQYCQFLEINGVRWMFEENHPEMRKVTNTFSLRRLFNISNHFALFKIEEIKLNSSFIAIRIGKTWQHKGQVYWFDLNTGEQISKSKLKCSK